MALLAMPLAASAWTPDGDVTVIVAYKAGSGTDTGARLLASQAEKYVGKTLIINNLPGGDGKIGWTELDQLQARRPHHRLHQPAHLHHPGRAARLYLRRQRRCPSATS